MQPVYFYVHDLRSSGVVRDALTFAAFLAGRRPTTLVAAYGDGLWRKDIADQPFDTVVLTDEPQGRLVRLAPVSRLRRWLKGQPRGLLFSLGNHGHSTAYLATRGLNHIRRAYRISNEIARPDGRGNGKRALWMRLLLRDAEHMALVGKALARHPVFADALRSGRATWVPSGVDLARAQTLARAPSPHPWFEESVPIVLCVGRLRRQKNLDLLIAGVAHARRERRIRLILLGGGTEAEAARLRALGDEAGMGEDLLLPGETTNVFAWLARADLFALTSRWEGSSLALLESLAVGTPVVASRLAGDAVDVLAEGRYGALFDGLDPRRLAACLLDQLSPGRIVPGDRAADYDLANLAQRYATMIDAIFDEHPLAMAAASLPIATSSGGSPPDRLD